VCLRLFKSRPAVRWLLVLTGAAAAASIDLTRTQHPPSLPHTRTPHTTHHRPHPRRAARRSELQPTPCAEQQLAVLQCYQENERRVRDGARAWRARALRGRRVVRL
jgi:hypothetical protein